MGIDENRIDMIVVGALFRRPSRVFVASGEHTVQYSIRETHQQGRVVVKPTVTMR
jgi:hypothetical protein